MSFDFNFTQDQLQQFLPRNPHVEHWFEALSQNLPDYQLTTVQRVASFLGETYVESAAYTAIQENLNYRAESLMRTWPSHFPTMEIANQYAHQPERIANRAYANRMGNGDEASGDGYKFCGRGLIQLTGKTNYTKFAADLGISVDETVAYLETPEGAVSSAGWFWDNNNLNSYCDKDDFVGLTKRINGGTIGLEDRKHHYELALSLI